MNVNLSATQLRDPKLLRTIEEIKHSSHAHHASMCFEITESAVLGDANRAIELLKEIRNLGFKLKIDDFGTGYSSLSYLKKLPIEGFKIDKSFITGLGIDEDDTAIVRALLGLSDAMGLNVTAEGVENNKQYELLKAYGCQYAQGYLFSKAIEAEEVVWPSEKSNKTA